MRFALVGYGRMGREIEKVAGARGHRLVAAVDPRADGRRVRRRLTAGMIKEAEVAFEFTAPESAEENVLTLLEMGVRVVCGTTG